MFVHTWLLGVLQSSLVWGLLDVFVNISSANQLLGPVPHGQPCRRVVEEHAIVARPYHTPGENGRKDTRRREDTKRKTEQHRCVPAECSGAVWHLGGVHTMECQGWGWWLQAWPSELLSPPPSSLLL